MTDNKTQNSWHQALELVKPFVFKIKTQNGYGTGFQISYSEKTKLCAIATAYHVIDQAYEWEHPIKIFNHESQTSTILHANERAIIVYPKEDLAIIVFSKNEQIEISKNSLPLIDDQKYLLAGSQAGWCGFPNISQDSLCFFAGYISCYLHNEKAYLVDGVAINGVSGGPAFYIDENGHKMFGVITAYMPNRATGETTPGLSVIRAIAPYMEFIKNFKSLDEAKEAEEAKLEPDNKID